MSICLNQLNQKRELALAISREHVRSSHLNSQTFCFGNSDNIYEYALKFLVRKDIPYLKKLNEFIQLASARGLIEKWHSHNNRKIQHSKKYNNISSRQLKIDHFKGVMIIYSVIMGFLFLTLYSERLIHKKARQPNPWRFWLIAEMFIEPHRLFWLETQTLNGHFAF